jgi:hypothetical protein
MAMADQDKANGKAAIAMVPFEGVQVICDDNLPAATMIVSRDLYDEIKRAMPVSQREN